MKARVMYGNEVLAIKDFPHNLAVDTELNFELAHGAGRILLKTRVQTVRVLAVAEGDITHEVVVTGCDAEVKTRMVAATVPDGLYLRASDILQVIMLITDRILDGNVTPELRGLHQRMNSLIPVLLKEGINPSAIEIIKDL